MDVLKLSFGLITFQGIMGNMYPLNISISSEDALFKYMEDKCNHNAIMVRSAQKSCDIRITQVNVSKVHECSHIQWELH